MPALRWALYLATVNLKRELHFADYWFQSCSLTKCRQLAGLPDGRLNTARNCRIYDLKPTAKENVLWVTEELVRLRFTHLHYGLFLAREKKKKKHFVVDWAFWARSVNGDATATRRNRWGKTQVRCGWWSAVISERLWIPWYPSPISPQRVEERPERASWRLAPASASLPGHLVRWVCQMVGLRDGYVWGRRGVDGKNRYLGYSMCANLSLPPNAMLHYYTSGFGNRCLRHRLDLCGHELLFVSAASLMFYLHIMCICLLHIIAYHCSLTCCIGSASAYSFT